MRDISDKMQQMRDFSCKNQGREPGRQKKKFPPKKKQFNFAPIWKPLGHSYPGSLLQPTKSEKTCVFCRLSNDKAKLRQDSWLIKRFAEWKAVPGWDIYQSTVRVVWYIDATEDRSVAAAPKHKTYTRPTCMNPWAGTAPVREIMWWVRIFMIGACSTDHESVPSSVLGS